MHKRRAVLWPPDGAALARLVALTWVATACACAPISRGNDAGDDGGTPWEDLGDQDGGAAPDLTFVPTGTIPTAPVCRRDGAAVQVTSTSAGTRSFALAWDVDHYLLVYADESTGEGDLVSVRLGLAGSPLSAPLVIESTATQSALPSLARTSTGWITTWQEGTSPLAVRVRRLDPDGQPMGSGVTLATSSAFEARPVVSRAPEGVAVSWVEEAATLGLVRGVVLDEALGQVGGPPRTLTDPLFDSRFPWLVGSDVSLALVWAEPGTLSGQGSILLARLGSDLQMTSSALVRSGSGEARLPRMIATAYGYLAAWEDSRTGENEVWSALADTSGTVFFSGLTEEPGTGDANWPNMATDGANAAVAYYQFRSGSPQIFMSFVDHRGQRVGGASDLQVSDTTASARYPDVVWTGNSYGVAWVDTRTGVPQIFMASVVCP